MLNLSDISKINRFAGRRPVSPEISPQQARQDAQHLLTQGLPPSLDRAVDWLSTAGVMTSAQLGISPRTLRTYNHSRVVDRLPFNSTEILNSFEEYGLPIPKQKEQALLYVLGPVGVEIAKIRYETTPPTGHTGFTLNRILHDVAVGELMLTIADRAIEHGWEPIWINEQSVTLYRGKQQILKPDALLRLKKEEEEYQYLIEYHNEDRSTRAKKKIQRYERVHASDIWKHDWEVESFPPILAVFREAIVGQGYYEGVSDLHNVRCTYYGRVLPAILNDIDIAYNFTSGQREYIWPWVVEKIPPPNVTKIQ